MFNRYWRTYPWFLQLSLFLLLIFTLTSFSTYLVLTLIPKFSGVPMKDIAELSSTSSFKTIHAALILQAVSHVGIFTAPALLFATFTHPDIKEYLGFRKPGKPIQWLIVTGIMIGLVPVFLWGESFMSQHLHFGAWADKLQAENNNTVRSFLRLSSGADLAVLLFVLALLPAFGEELVFRGVLLRLFHRRVWKSMPVRISGDRIIAPDVQRSMVSPVIMTALLFAAMHFNPYGFVFIFIAGCVLALIYFLTRSILCSIWAHFLYNGIQVTGAFFTHHNEAANKLAEADNIPVVYAIAGLIIFAISFFALVKNQTPLQANWSDDYSDSDHPKEQPTNHLFN